MKNIKKFHRELTETGKIVFDRKGYHCHGNNKKDINNLDLNEINHILHVY